MRKWLRRLTVSIACIIIMITVATVTGMPLLKLVLIAAGIVVVIAAIFFISGGDLPL
ncbi:MAG: hypothetical protein ACE5LC_07930 [Candidatus Aminicenantales bacterium]